MTLATSKIIGFIPSSDLSISMPFYEEKLGLTLIYVDEIALEFSIYQAKLRVTKVTGVTPTGFTVFGWEVDDIEATVNDLMLREIKFEKYLEMSQSELGICTFPGGSRVAWFKDPDGNTLSITQDNG